MNKELDFSGGTLVETHDLTKYFYQNPGLFRRKRAPVKALEDVTLSITQQETLGVVGESGCGKTTLGRVLLNLIHPTAGKVIFDGQDLSNLDPEGLRKARREMQIVFQNPYLSFDPRFSIKRSLSEPLLIHTKLRGAEMESQARQTLEQVGMPGDAVYRYPHEFSGGQLQRIAVARALILNPKFIVLDEPTSALDVSVQAQILNLLRGLQESFKLTYLFISHDLGVVQYISNRIAVMYLGKVVEIILTRDLIANLVQHPYTKTLMLAIPEVYPAPGSARSPERRQSGQKSFSSIARMPVGCSFQLRCNYAMPMCTQVEPQLMQIADRHWLACHLVNVGVEAI
jgi:oligopeptide/dipeptide ABC transporter ATP-binding protein